MLETVRKILLPLLILIVAVLITYGLIVSKPQTAPVAVAEKAWLVQVMPVELGTYAPSVTLYGRVDSLWSTQLTAAVEADVLTVEQVSGAKVQKGQVLVRLDAREAQLRLDQAQADLVGVQAQLRAESIRHKANQTSLPREQRLLNLARNEEKRLKKLVAKKVTTQSALDTARQQVQVRAIALTHRQQLIAEHDTRLAEIRTRIARANAAVEQASLVVERCQIVAPFNGVISQQQVAPGQRVRPGQVILSLYDTDAMVIRAQIPNSYLAVIRQAMADGVELPVQGELAGQVIKAQIGHLGGEIEAGAGGVEAVLPVTTEQPGLLQGRFVELTLSLPMLTDVMAVPHEALYGINRLYQLDDQSRLRSVIVERLGEVRLDAQQTRVLVRSAQLQPGMQLVVTQLPQAIEGLLVRQAEG